MRRDRLAAAVGTVLFLDALRVFLLSLTTLFGQAGSTSPALMGAFALAWFLVPFLFVLLARLIAPTTLAPAAAVAMVAGRLVLQATGGGGPQLYVSAATVGAGAVWLALLDGAPPDTAGVPSVAAPVAGQFSLAACAGWAVLPRAGQARRRAPGWSPGRAP